MKTFVTFILYYPRLTLFFLIFKGFLISYVYASDLPPCPSKGPYHDCFGTYVWVTESKKGDKYVGEFKDNKMHGYGTMTRSPGTGFVFSGDISTLDNGKMEQNMDKELTFGLMVINMRVNGEVLG